MIVPVQGLKTVYWILPLSSLCHPLVRGLYCARPRTTGPNYLGLNSASAPEFGNEVLSLLSFQGEEEEKALCLHVIMLPESRPQESRQQVSISTLQKAGLSSVCRSTSAVQKAGVHMLRGQYVPVEYREQAPAFSRQQVLVCRRRFQGCVENRKQMSYSQ